MRPSLLWFAVDNYCCDVAAVVADALEMRDAKSGRGHGRVHDDAVGVAVPVAPVPPRPDGVADGDDDATSVVGAAAVADADGAGDIDVYAVA